MTEGQLAWRTCVHVDLEDYSRLQGVEQGVAQQALADALTAAADRCGLNRLRWERQPGGDGELAILPGDESQIRVVAAFPIALDAELRARHRNGGLRLRLRMAVVHGVVTPAALGYADNAVITAARMVDAAPVRQALARAQDAYLVLALSTDLYQNVIKHGTSDFKADRFRRVPIERIESDAWITAPGVDSALMDPDTCPAVVGTTETSEPGPTFSMNGQGSTGYQNVFNGLKMGGGDFHIGPRHELRRAVSSEV